MIQTLIEGNNVGIHVTYAGSRMNTISFCECSAYEAHREVLYKVTGIIPTSNEAHFKELMQSNEPSAIEALSNFLKEASDIRRNHQGR